MTIFIDSEKTTLLCWFLLGHFMLNGGERTQRKEGIDLAVIHKHILPLVNKQEFF